MYKSLVIDEQGLNYLQRANVHSAEWLNDLRLPVSRNDLSLRVVNDIAYLLSDRATIDSRLLIIKSESDGLFSNVKIENRIEVFERICQAGLSIFESSVSVPVRWKPYHNGPILSFQSNRKSTGENARVGIDTHPKGQPHAYVFSVGLSQTERGNVNPEYDIYQDSINSYPDAILAEPRVIREDEEEISNSIELTDTLPQGFTHGLSVKEWYDSKLTNEQRKFVDFPLDKSVRLRGPAGSGKTLALVIKCVKAIYDNKSKGGNLRIAFLTHSAASVDLVRSMMNAIDVEGVLYSSDSRPELKICTLLELADEAVNYDLYDLFPLSVDGLEGRRLQMELLSSIIAEFKKSDWVAYKGGCSDAFVKYMELDEDDPAHRYFVWELMNEFASVLDADGVRESWDRRNKYITEKRKAWMMRLDKEEDRKVVLELYTLFRKELKEMGAIGVDQMISDYLGYLDSNRWDSIRNRNGFDIVFVDELHLFNRQERMVFHHLMKDQKSSPVVIMAYDAKQSPRDTFLGMTEKDAEKFNFWKDAGLGQVKSFELQDIFRYTPEIEKVLYYIDQSFPAIGLEDEWPEYQGVSRIEPGPKPIAVEMEDTTKLYNFVFPRAKSKVKEIGKGRRVAVLCASMELFELYLDAGQYKKDFVSISSREELSNIVHAGKRFVFSMPEYVAGLQFDTVYLIEVNKAEIPEGPHAAGATRRFVSQVYLGASRAEYCLEIYATKERGGISDVLEHAFRENAVDMLDSKSISAK